MPNTNDMEDKNKHIQYIPFKVECVFAPQVILQSYKVSLYEINVVVVFVSQKINNDRSIDRTKKLLI